VREFAATPAAAGTRADADAVLAPPIIPPLP
jgi:hypothetical protein